ncbi:MAG TPA: DNA-3-methyladenine glycosylase [Cytophagales bacterium]|nr:DNA-3-methyladenine glycosylase [Cytophagales bacterium]HCR53786.1 DNA-3-methyladenine glycosylase [Cytophagales bacterium]
MNIALPSEFRFKECLHFLERSPRELLHKVEGDAVYKLVNEEGEKILFKVTSSDDHLTVDFPIAEPNDAIKKKIEPYIIEWFDLDKDLRPFYAMAANDPLLSHLIKKYFGYRIVGQPDLYESLVWAVLGQQINLSFAYTLKQQFVREYGKKLVYADNEYFLFPEPGVVTHLTMEELLKIQFSRQKARYTINISEAFLDGTISKEKLKGLSLVDAKEKLMKIKGIGNWTANYALMKTFRYPDAFPLEDAGVSNAIKQFLQLNRKPTLDEIREVFVKYKGWEAYATLYLWRSL